MAALRRGLTVGEVSALPPGLVAAIDAAGVELLRAHLWVSYLAMLIGRGAQIVVRGRRIFWPHLPADVSDTPELLAVLAHELTHVWQYAHGMTLWRYILRERGRYGYVLDGRPFADFGYEQQASIVEDWVRMRLGLMARHSERLVRLSDLAEVVPFA
ncbi:hypothetical protein [Asticcacaulis biprosthecium]|uniref:hypothetical protein n=1 Tax=Asticcacaulis biprosthecium TaxID=76891 RepID=UPI0002DA3C70|nr:hypothetical protein [Asticcacaulis biprosthecium]